MREKPLSASRHCLKAYLDHNRGNRLVHTEVSPCPADAWMQLNQLALLQESWSHISSRPSLILTAWHTAQKTSSYPQVTLCLHEPPELRNISNASLWPYTEHKLWNCKLQECSLRSL